jgi:hypothetical protein
MAFYGSVTKMNEEAQTADPYPRQGQLGLFISEKCEILYVNSSAAS